MQTGDYIRMEGHYLGGTQGTHWAVYDRLTQYDAKLQPQPRLAESWDVSPDFKQIKINLRKGVVFHSGREMTSEDIKYNITRVKDPKVGIGQLVNMASWFTTIETPDKNTVILKSDASRPAMFDLFEHLNIVDREVIEGPEGPTKLSGTGPFIFTEWKQGVSARYVKNKNWWGSGKPYVDELLVTFAGDQQAMVLQLEAGTVDMIDKPAIPDLVRLSKDPRFTVVRNELAGASYSIGFNTKLPPTDNQKLRQAIGYATDRKRFADTVFQGYSQPQVLPWPAHSPAYDDSKLATYGYDLEKARKLVQESGLTNPEVDVIYSSEGTPSQMAALSQIMQQDAGKVGIKLNIKPMGGAAWNAASKDLAFPFVNLATTSFSNIEPSTNFLLSAYWTPASNNEGFKNERYEQLVGQIGSEPDAAKRKAVYNQLNEFILEQAFLLTVAQDPRAAITQNYVRGLHYTQAPQLTAFEEVWLDR